MSARPQPLLAVRDVPASARWYASLLDASRTSELMASDHAHLYDRLLVDGELVLQLHAWDAEDHANLVDPDGGRNGHGVLLWFELDDLDAAVERSRSLGAEVVEEVHVNPAPDHREMWLRDPDGYLVVICSPDGEASSPRPSPMPITQGDLFWVDEPTSQVEGLSHPYLVIQDDVLNGSRVATIVACALTTRMKAATEIGNVRLDGGEGNLPKPSVVVVSQVESFHRRRLIRKIGTLSEARVREVLTGMAFQQRSLR